jgi:hypothetical protein
LFGHEEAGASALGLDSNQEKAGSYPNKILALYSGRAKKTSLNQPGNKERSRVVQLSIVPREHKL